MESMLAAISSQFTKSLILGAFFPVVLFVLLGIWLLAPLLPSDLPVLALLNSLDRQWFLFALSFLIVLISGFLYNLNIPIIRLYEGYPWKATMLGERFTDMEKANLTRMEKAFVRLRALREGYKKLDKGNSNLEEIKKQLNHAARIKFNQYPEESKVLPTRLGNVIRSFEDYPWRQYGIASVTLWSRVIAVAPKEYVAVADDAKTSVDFFINCSFLSLLFAICLGLFGGAFHAPFLSWHAFWPWLSELVFFLLLFRWCYGAAIVSAAAWGEQVKGVFDLYRFTLLRSLGYTQMPSSREEERKIWKSISLQMLYGDPEEGAPGPPYAPEQIMIAAEPSGIKLQVASGGQATAKPDVMTFVHQISNADTRDAAEIEVKQDLAGSFFYQWESAEAGGNKVTPLSARPLTFHLGPLAAGKTVLFTFSVFRVSAPENPDGAKPAGAGPAPAAKP